MSKTILMKVTSRSRPLVLLETVREYIRMATNTKDMVWLFSFDEEDGQYNNADFKDKLNDLIWDSESRQGELCLGQSSGKINAINRDVNEFELGWDILLNISDDQRPIIKGYDDIIRNAMPDYLDASLWFSDGQPRINTQEILGRVYYERFNYIYHPDYISLWCDNEATEVANMLGKQIKSSKQIIKHYHPAWGGSESLPTDDLYRRNDKFWAQDEATFKRRKLINFGLK